MTKINKEEYQILKNIDRKWKWIVRDKTTSKSKRSVLFLFPDKPRKHRGLNQWIDPNPRAGVHIIPSDLLQFIHWDNEEPFSIAELIEEYEKEMSK